MTPVSIGDMESTLVSVANTQRSGVMQKIDIS